MRSPCLLHHRLRHRSPMTTFVAPTTSTKEDRAHAEPTDDRKTASHAAARHGRRLEGAGTRLCRGGAELSRTTGTAGGSAVELARESGAGTQTQSRKVAGWSLRGRYRLSRRPWLGQNRSARSSQRVGLGAQSREHFRDWALRRGQELSGFGVGTESLPRWLLGALYPRCRLVARSDSGTRRW